MYDTTITIVGNVATQPSQRQYPSGTLTDFRVASTSRRYDRRLEKWVDGDELFVKVRCWRSLGDNVEQSVKVGDPVIVRGRLYSRRFTDDDNVARQVFEVNAQAVGHDLARGVGRFTRGKARANAPAGAGGDPRGEFDAIVGHLTAGQSQSDDADDGASQPALTG